MDQNKTAAQVLQGWLLRGYLNSQYEAYIEDCIRRGESWYTRILAQQGKDVAEARLTAWNQARRMSDYAAGIEPVARAMLALAQSDTKGTLAKVTAVNSASLFRKCLYMRVPGEMVVVLNPETLGCGCSAPEGAEDWAPNGRLGLKAVTLQAGLTHQGKPCAELGLVLPQRSASVKNVCDDAFTVAIIDLTGGTDGERYTPMGFRRNGWLQYNLGLIELEEAVWNMRSGGGHFDDAVGFPGATQYLANALPSLAEYLTGLAVNLADCGHTH